MSNEQTDKKSEEAKKRNKNYWEHIDGMKELAREDVTKLMESRQGVLIGQVLKGELVAKTTSKATEELSKGNEGKSVVEDPSKTTSEKTVKEDR